MLQEAGEDGDRWPGQGIEGKLRAYPRGQEARGGSSGRGGDLCWGAREQHHAWNSVRSRDVVFPSICAVRARAAPHHTPSGNLSWNLASSPLRHGPGRRGASLPGAPGPAKPGGTDALALARGHGHPGRARGRRPHTEAAQQWRGPRASQRTRDGRGSSCGAAAASTGPKWGHSRMSLSYRPTPARST
jgi:hypothetical protein